MTTGRLGEWSRLHAVQIPRQVGTARLLIDLDYTIVINSKSCPLFFLKKKTVSHALATIIVVCSSR